MADRNRYLQKSRFQRSLKIGIFRGPLKDCFLFSEAKRFDVKGKRYFEYPSKFYCTDIGLRNVRLGLRQMKESHILENCIYSELLIRDFSVDVGVIPIIEKKLGLKELAKKLRDRFYSEKRKQKILHSVCT